jgi:hypothetical protein
MRERRRICPIFRRLHDRNDPLTQTSVKDSHPRLSGVGTELALGRRVIRASARSTIASSTLSSYA